MKKEKIKDIIVYITWNVFWFLLSIGLVQAQENSNVFSDASCLNFNPLELCFQSVSWDDKDQHILLTQDTTISVNMPDSLHFYLRYRLIGSFTLIEVVSDRQLENLPEINLQQSNDSLTYKNVLFDQVRNSDKFCGSGISEQLHDDQRFFRLSTDKLDGFVYLFLRSKS